MKQRELIKKLEAAGFEFSRHGGNHDVYVRGSDIEQIPRHKEINEMLAKAILRKWDYSIYNLSHIIYTLIYGGYYIMKQVYPVIFTQLNDKKDTVLINVPDMNILTEGFGLPDAIEMARDAIGANGITLQDLGREIPVPSDISDIDIKNGPFDNTGISHVSFVDIDFDEYRRKVDNKTVRRNVTLPNWLNQEAEKSHINVSRVLQEALMVKLGVSR